MNWEFWTAVGRSGSDLIRFFLLLYIALKISALDTRRIGCTHGKAETRGGTSRRRRSSKEKRKGLRDRED